MLFFVGLHHPADARHFDRAFVSVNALRRRKGTFPANSWIMDSGAFTEISTHGRWRTEPEDYVALIHRHARSGRLLAAVSQDYMCEPWILAKTGMTVEQHQSLTVARYDRIVAASRVLIIPVLQGYSPQDYVRHLAIYDGRLKTGAWVGVGSICKRNAKPESVREVLSAIKSARPDLRLHGFGLKTTALDQPEIRDMLYSADSMAWSFAARREGRDANDWREAKRFEERVIWGRRLVNCPNI